MVISARLDNDIEILLTELAFYLKKNKSEIIRDSIKFYAENIKSQKKSRIAQAVKKTAKSDYKESMLLEDSLNDGL